jgi:arylsulfatase A-like enzyme
MKPNFLIFMTDQQQAAVADPGHPCKMPHFRAFAEQGMQFMRAYTPTALCAPARASMMSSLYPHAHGMLNNNHVFGAMRLGLNHGIPMFSERVKEAGYKMSYLGKWHVSKEKGPGAYGWELPDAETQIKLWGPYPFPMKRGRKFELKRKGWKPYELFATVTEGPETFQEYRWTDYACGKLAELGKQDKPWCLYLGLHGPHDPFLAPSSFVDQYDLKSIPKPESFGDRLHDKPAVYKRQREELWGNLSWDDYAEAIRHYWAYNTFIDTQFGKLLSALEATGQAENTLVITLSDHGEMMGAHGLFFKGVAAFEEGYRIPMAARWPKLIKPGQACDEFATLLDIGPTFIDLAGGKPIENASGRSLRPIFQGETPLDWPQSFYGQYHGSELYYTQRLLTTKRYKYVFNGFDFDELYDLHKDPHELKNLYHSPKHQDILHDMVRKLWKRALAVGDQITCHAYPTTDLLPIGPEEVEP